MERTILVPLDGASLGERALPFAAAFAQAFGARVHLTRVVSANPAPDFSPLLAELAELVDMERAEHYLQQLAASSQQHAGVTTSAVLAGDPIDQLCIEAGRICADTVVLATANKTKLGRNGFGAVAEGLLNALSVPIVMIRPWHVEDSLRTLTSANGRILVPLDGSARAEAIIPVATTFAAALAAEIVLLGVLPAPASAGEGVPRNAVAQPRQEDVEGYLQYLASRVVTAGRQARHEVRFGDAADTITTTARALDVGLIAMATHGQSDGQSILGRVANDVVWSGAVPTLLLGGTPGAT